MGLGALGTALAKALAGNGAELISVFSRTFQKAQAISEAYNIPAFSSFPSRAEHLGSLVFLTVPDSAIGKTANKLARISGSFAGKTFVHCSGNEAAGILHELKEKGALIASAHPLQTFNAHSGPGDFSNIYFSLQGDSETFSMLTNIVELLGARTLIVNEQQKSHLHAAAVFASNYLITLLDASAEAGNLGGLPAHQVREVLYPLVRTTVKNVENSSFEETISGPIARGDIETVNKHLQLLDDRRELKLFYASLGLKTVSKAEEAGKLKHASADKLRQLLTGAKSNG